jgi:serine/threonine protein kinase
MNPNDDQVRDLLDRWEELHDRGEEPSVEELCRDAPQLVDALREWIRVLKCGDWLNRRADELADETLGELGRLTAEEGNRCRAFGEYELIEELGGGGMGRVFKATHRKMNRTVAVKLLPDSHGQLPDSIRRFQREIQTLAHLSHPNIVGVHDAGAADGTHFYVMDFVDGTDLARLVNQRGPMSVETALDCILQAARGLEHAHAKGIVHRDVKPSNLILGRDGTLKILDLGIARFRQLSEMPGDDLTKTGCVLGTIDYMAPEQAMNTRRADHRADVYGLGCTLYYLLTAQPLFGGDTVMERLIAHREHPAPSLKAASPAVPQWLDGVFQKMVAKKPEDRQQSMKEVIADLTRTPAPPGNRSRRVATAAAALLLLLLLAFFIPSWASSRRDRGPRSSWPAGFEILDHRTDFVPDNKHASAHSSGLLLEVSRDKAKTRGGVFAGVELKGTNVLNVDVADPATIQRLRHDSFIGFVIDYHTASGYTKRVSLSMGTEWQRTSDKPPWGKHSESDDQKDLGCLPAYHLKLRDWAPPSWDGQFWIAFVLQHTKSHATLTARLAPAASAETTTGTAGDGNR